MRARNDSIFMCGATEVLLIIPAGGCRRGVVPLTSCQCNDLLNANWVWSGCIIILTAHKRHWVPHPFLCSTLPSLAPCLHTTTPLIHSSPAPTHPCPHTPSGHGAFWALAPCVLSSYYPNHRWSLALVWVALVQSSTRDFLEHMHYSIDMLLAVVVTAAVWGWLRWVYPEAEPLQKRPEGAKADPANPYVLALVAFGLFTAAVIILVAKA